MKAIELPRQELMERVRLALRRNPVTALIGPRQCGKTTLARQFAAQQPTEYFDLEFPSDLERLAHPMTALEPLKGLVVIDEVQRKPELCPRGALTTSCARWCNRSWQEAGGIAEDRPEGPHSALPSQYRRESVPSRHHRIRTFCPMRRRRGDHRIRSDLFG